MDAKYPGNEDGFQYLVMNGNKNPGNKAYLVTSADLKGNTFNTNLRKKSSTIKQNHTHFIRKSHVFCVRFFFKYHESYTINFYFNKSTIFMVNTIFFLQRDV